MTANINKTHGKYNVFVVGQPAWHGLGTVLDKPATAAEAIELAGLDYDVVKQPTYYREEIVTQGKVPSTSYNFIEVPGSFATVRKDTGAPLGVVGNQYTVLQNRDAFNFFDEVVDQGAAIYTSAGVLGIGQRIWIAAKLPRVLHVGKGDDVELYTVITNGHDGRISLQVLTTPVRIVCSNTLNAAIGAAQDIFKIRHTSGLPERVKEAHAFINVVDQEAAKLEEAYQALARIRLNSKVIKSMVNAMLPATRVVGKADVISTQLQKKRDRVLELVETAPGNDLVTAKGTAWGVYNAFTHYIDYASPMGNNYLKTQFNGSREKQRSGVYHFLKALGK